MAGIVGRPRLPSPERRRRKILPQNKWKIANLQAYRAGKAAAASRPEYLAKRRERYILAKRLALEEGPCEDTSPEDEQEWNT
jgi:hypothetical protein